MKAIIKEEWETYYARSINKIAISKKILIGQIMIQKATE